ncbi:hypothetical protein H6P81_001107 [Aristolochia fimbriata]|uniref:Formin-like protein n=1 Tax=Aristolochia fimbriata TaxID=158543 RepID=A0AAV7F6N3_ARIFI|nr:hypothetical protein H6P81_001107 [Aristolochia fimbriata]
MELYKDWFEVNALRKRDGERAKRTVGKKSSTESMLGRLLDSEIEREHASVTVIVLSPVRTPGFGTEGNISFRCISFLCMLQHIDIHELLPLSCRFFYRRPPDGLLEFADRVYVFDSCFSTEVLPDEMYHAYLHETMTELHEAYVASSFLAFNFREGEKRSQFSEVLCEYDVTVVDYPRQYEGCPLLPLSLIQHFLCLCERWLNMKNNQNIILLHCERGGWPILAFLLASFLLYRKLNSGEQRTLEMVHREAPKGLLQLLSPLNPFASQLRYAQYIARRNISSEWPPIERALSLDCLILRAIPSFDSRSGCRPIIRVFGRNLHSKGGLSTQMLFSMPKKKKSLLHYKQGDCDVIKIDIQCLVKGDVVLECLHVDLDTEREIMMFRIVFNTAFVRSNIMMLNRDDLDILWDSKKRFPKGFRAEVLFGEVDSITTPRAPTATLNSEEEGGLPIEAFSSVQELFSDVEWVDGRGDATLWLLRQFSASALQEKLEKLLRHDVKEKSGLQGKTDQESTLTDSEEEKDMSQIAEAIDPLEYEKDPSAEGHDITKLVPYHTSLSPIKEESNIPLPPSSPSTYSPPKKYVPPVLLPTRSCPPPPPPLPPPLISGNGASLPQSSALVSTTASSPSSLLSSQIASSVSISAPPSLPSTTPASLAKASPPPPPPPPPLPPSTIISPCPLSLMSLLPFLHHHHHPPTSSWILDQLRHCHHRILLLHLLPKDTRSTASLPPPPPPPPPANTRSTASLPPPPPPPPPPANTRSTASLPPPPPPPPPPANTRSTASLPPPPPPPPPPGTTQPHLFPTVASRTPPPPPPPPGTISSGPPLAPTSARGNAPAPPPPPPRNPSKGPTPPPPPQVPKPPGAVPPPPPGRCSQPVPPPPPGMKMVGAPVPPPPSLGRGRGSVTGRARGAAAAPKKSLKALHWVKVTRAVQGSLWADSQKQENQSKDRAPEINLSELESLFSAAAISEGSGVDKGGRKGPSSNKPEIVHLVDLRRANNCEIMLTKIKMPLPDMINAVLALDASTLDTDQLENLIKFCPTKEEMEMLKNYTGSKEMLGKCEQFFLELMRVPRVESKLRVFSFTIAFPTQVMDLRSNLITINNVSNEVKTSTKLTSIMKTILNLGNALNHGTARGSAVGFKLDSLLKLSDTRARNNKMTLMHYLCKLIAEQQSSLLDFHKELVHLEAASKIQLKALAEEMQAVSKGLEKVEQELIASENDGAISVGFRKALKSFLDAAEAKVRSLTSLYSEVGRNADSLALYFGEDPARCPFEQVTSILMIFVNTFNKSHEENMKRAEAEKKKMDKEAMKEKASSLAKKEIS